MATTSIPANCAAVTQTMMQLSGQLSGPMFNRLALKRPIIRYVQATRGAWENGMGTSVSAVTFEKAFPALTGDPWTNIGVSDGDTANACRPASETVAFGQTSRSFQPRQYAVNTQDFCIRDILQGWQFRDFLGNVNKALDLITEWVWARRYTLDYYTIAGHKITFNSNTSPTDSATSYDVSNVPTSALTLGLLSNIKLGLAREGGGNPTAFDESTGEPVFTVIASPETLDNIIRNNPDLRQDVRYAFMGKGEDSPLIPGVPLKKRNYAGYIFEAELFPRRFVLSGGAYLEIAPFVASSTTKGNKWEINAAYSAAPYEEVIIYHQDNYQSLAVNTVTDPAPGWKFDPHNWMGQFEPRNILDRTCNPDGDIIFLRALFADAAKPLNPAVGYTVLVQRCGYDNAARNCYGYAV